MSIQYLTVTSGYLLNNAVNNISTVLTQSIDSSQTTIYASTTGWPSSGVLSINTEVIYYSGISGSSFTGCTRGYDSTVAATHVQNALVELRWIAAHHNRTAGEILKIEQVLGESVSAATNYTTDYDTLDARITTFEVRENTPSPPSAQRPGDIYHQYTGGGSTNVWWMYSCVSSSWEAVANLGTLGFSDDWNVVTVSPRYIEPRDINIGFVKNNYGTILTETTFYTSLAASISGYGVIGVDSDGKFNDGNTTLAYKTSDQKFVGITDDDRMAQPWVTSFNFDNPVDNEITHIFTVPDGYRRIRKIYLSAFGESTDYLEVGLYRNTITASILDADLIATVALNCVNSVTASFTSVTVGAWNSISFGVVNNNDYIFAKVNSISGSPQKATVTAEMPYTYEG